MRKKGFTFVELMMAVGISVGVMSVVFAFYISTHKFFFKGSNQSVLVSDVKNSMNLIVEYLSRAEEILEMEESSITFKAHTLKSGDIDEYSMGDLHEVTIKMDKKEKFIELTVDDSSRYLIKEIKLNMDEEGKPIPFLTPFIKDYNSENFIKYEPEYSDSEKEQRIVYIRLRIRGSVGDQEVDLVTGTRLEFIHSKMLQPYWKFN